MQHFLAGLALIGLYALPCECRAADKAGEAAGVPISDLIAKLGDKNFRVRQAAGKALEDRGEEALPVLRQALGNDDEEIRQRVEVLTQKIERSVLLTPKRVSISMKDRPIDEVVKELARQTGYKLQYQGGQPRKISVDMENATYWKVLEKICNDGRLYPGFDEQQGLVFLYQQDTISPYTYHAGPFRFVATNFNYNRYVNLANLPRNGQDPNNNFDNNLNFSFMIQAEPKVPLLGVSAPRLTKAEDENGISLLPRHYENEGAYTVQYFDGGGQFRNFQHSTGVQMSKPAKDATRAKIIKGKVTVTLLSATKADVVFDKLAVGKKKLSAAGQSAEIDINEVAEQNKAILITLHIKKRIRNGEPPDYNWINGVQQKMELLDAKGRKYQSQGVTNFLNNSPTAVHATYQFMPPNGDVGPPTKFVFNQWLTMSHELEFEFKDLPLP
jgi:hypothetical protein